MNRLHIPPRLIEYLLGILATAMIAAGIFLYAYNEPQRIAAAQEAQIQFDLDEAMSLYAENCSVCHGLAGEGIGATPALNNPALAQSDFDSLAKIIARGLYGTAMPAWSLEDGGPLSDYQISELVVLIQQGDWLAVQDRVVNLGLAPRVPFTTQPDAAILAQVSALPDGELLAQGIQLYAEQCVACHGADGLGSSLAPALNDPLVREKTPDELERTIRSGISGTLMAAWENALSDEQIAAALALLTRWQEVPAGAIPAPDRPLPVTAESLALGGELYTANCSRCHGPEGQGTPRAPALNVKGFLTATSDAAIQQIVTLGVTGTAMPAWGDRLGDAEIQAIVGFLRAWEPAAPEVAEPARGGGGPWWRNNTSAASGQSSMLPSWQRSVQSAPQGSATTSGGQGQHTGSSAGSGTASGAGAGSGPAWAQSPQPAWWQQLDWRAWSILGGGLALSLGLIGGGLVIFRRAGRAVDRAGWIGT